MNKAEKWIEYIVSAALIIAGVVGIALQIVLLLGLKLSENTQTNVILTLLAFLALALGLERVIRFRRVDERLLKFDELVRSGLGGRRIMGYEQNYTEAARLGSTAESQIQALLVGGGKAPDAFIRAIGKRIREQSSKGHSLTFYVLLAVDPAKLPAAFPEQIEARMKKYENYGASRAVRLYITESTSAIGIDTFIVDSKHLLLGINASPDNALSETGILMENVPALADNYSRWFHQILLPDARPYEDWLRTWQPTLNQN